MRSGEEGGVSSTKSPSVACALFFGVGDRDLSRSPVGRQLIPNDRNCTVGCHVDSSDPTRAAGLRFDATRRAYRRGPQ